MSFINDNRFLTNPSIRFLICFLLGRGLVGVGVGDRQISFAVFIRCIWYLRLLLGREAFIIPLHVIDLLKFERAFRFNVPLTIRRVVYDLPDSGVDPPIPGALSALVFKTWGNLASLSGLVVVLKQLAKTSWL